jgi:AcrR family transcriptional regulator
MGKHAMGGADSRPGKQRRIGAVERRARILESALTVFAQRGYADASMAAIAAAAGITPAVIYDHFASKAELYMTLLQHQAEALMTNVVAAVASTPDPPEARFRAGVEAYFTFVEDQGFAWWLLFRDPPAEPQISTAYRQIQHGATAALATLLRESAPRQLRDRPRSGRDLEMFAQLLRTAQNGLAAWWYEHPDTPRAELIDRVMEFAWIGLERVSRP